MNDYSCYDILKNDIYGRYAVASKDLEPGDLITAELPFTYGPKSDSPVVCLGCHCGVDGRTLCSTCGWPVCNEICEKLAIHSENECVTFSKVGVKFTTVKDVMSSCPQYECIMPLRVLLTKEREKDKWEKEVKPLESHYEERKKTEMWRVEDINVVRFLHKVCKLEGRFSGELIHFVCGILEVNAFIAPVAYGFEMRCLYPKSSLLTHSCVPNVGHYIFHMTNNQVTYRIYMRAMVKIKKGQELLLTYTQTLSPTLFRRASLKEGKYFGCTCKRCADPTELGTNLSTLKCKKCENGWLTSTNPLGRYASGLATKKADEKAVWKCSCCEFVTEVEEVLKLLHVVQKEANDLHFLEGCDPVASREAFIKKHKPTLHSNHAVIMFVKSSLSQLYGRAEGYHLKDLSDSLLQRKIDLCKEINSVSNIIKPGLSRQRGYCQIFILSNQPGWNLYELYAPIILQAKNQLRRNEIDEKQLRSKFEEAAEYLEEAEIIFSYDDPESPEGLVGKRACQILKDLRSSIQALPA